MDGWGYGKAALDKQPIEKADKGKGPKSTSGKPDNDHSAKDKGNGNGKKP